MTQSKAHSHHIPHEVNTEYAMKVTNVTYIGDKLRNHLRSNANDPAVARLILSAPVNVGNAGAPDVTPIGGPVAGQTGQPKSPLHCDSSSIYMYIYIYIYKITKRSSENVFDDARLK